MGGCLDLHADPRRGLSPAEYACETSVHWNGPSMAECDSLLECYLNKGRGQKGFPSLSFSVLNFGL